MHVSSWEISPSEIDHLLHPMRGPVFLYAVFFVVVSVQGDGHVYKYKRANVNIKVDKFGTLTKDLVGSVKGTIIDHILSKRVDEKHAGVSVAKDGTESVRLNMYLSESGDRLVVRGNKQPLLTMTTTRYPKSTKTVSTIFWKSQGGEELNKLCFQMFQPLPDTPQKMWEKIIEMGAGHDGFGATCGQQQSSDECKAYGVCQAKKSLFLRRFKECKGMPGWGDKVFKPCHGHGGSEVCHYTKTGQRLKVYLMERMWLKKRSPKGRLMHKLREKRLHGSDKSQMTMRTTIHEPREESFDYEHVGKCIYDQHPKKFKMLNFIPTGPAVDFVPCDPGSDALVEVGEGADLSATEKALVSRLQTLTEADMSTEKGLAAMKGLSDVLVGIGIGLGAVLIIGIFLLIKVVAFLIVPIMCVAGIAFLAALAL